MQGIYESTVNAEPLVSSENLKRILIKIKKMQNK